jgi:type II secretory pathway predicted ATPase ExeA
MRQLIGLLAEHGIGQGEVAEHCGISRSSFNKFLRTGRELQRAGREQLREGIAEFLEQRGIAREVALAAIDDPGLPGKVADTRCNGGRPDVGRPSDESEEAQREDLMLLRKQRLFQSTRQHFGLFRDPFTDDVNEPADVFLSANIRTVREAMWQVAKFGSSKMLAVVGESGSGKSTLRSELIERIYREHAKIIPIEPYVLGMEENDDRGKTLKATHIAEALLREVAPLQKPMSSAEARFAQVHKALKDSAQTGYSHVLIIEEAHGMNINTLKHLKRFAELSDGMRKLLGVILLGQPELETKLEERNLNVREVSQRCEIVRLHPLDESLEEYLRFKMQRIGADLGKVFDRSGLEALRAKLTDYGAPAAKDGKGGGPERGPFRSLLYPLAVHNVVTGAMNLAADSGLPVVDDDVLKGV